MKFEVWHAEPPNSYGAAEVGARFPMGFAPVATVEAETLDGVLVLTNDLTTDWLRNAGVLPLVARARSTSLGDVVVAPNGRRWMRAKIGWVELRALPRVGGSRPRVHTGQRE